MGTDGKPFCPRRKWQQDIKAVQEDANSADPLAQVTPGQAILGTFGTEGTGAEGDNSLRNPVYLDNGKTSLVWIATLRDNSGMRSIDDKEITPSILDANFDTDWIHCRPIPYIPAQHEAFYRTAGGLKEGDQVLAITTGGQQNESTAIPSNNTDNLQYNNVQIEGVVLKTNFVFRTPRSTVEVDHTVSGT